MAGNKADRSIPYPPHHDHDDQQPEQRPAHVALNEQHAATKYSAMQTLIADAQQLPIAIAPEPAAAIA